MYNLLEYSQNYSKTPASLWNYYRDKLTDETNKNNGPNKNDDDNPANNPDYDQNKRGTKEVEIAVPLKHLGNF